MWNLVPARRAFLPVAIAMLCLCTSAGAQSLGNWQFGTANLRDGTQQMASLTASTMLSGGTAGDYAPVLTLTCSEGDSEHWQLQFQLEEPLTSRGIITLWASYDGSDPVAQQWVVTGNKRTATLVNAQAVARLSRARSFKLQWNWGWSWLWLSDSAEFKLGDPHTVVFTLAKSCSIPLPQ